MSGNQESNSGAPSRQMSGVVIAINEPSDKPAGQSTFALGQIRAEARSQSAVQSAMSVNEGPTSGQPNAQNGKAGDDQQKAASMHSFGSGSSSTNTHGKELVETTYFKMKGTKWNWFSLINNVILLVVLLELAAPAGLFFNIGPEIFTHGGPVIFHVWMHILHYISHMAVNEALGVFLGYLMSRPHGYSLACCGFSQAGIFLRITYPGLLSYKSKIKKFLTYVVYFLIVHSALLACTILSSTAVFPQVMRQNLDTLACVVQVIGLSAGLISAVAMGSAEFAFGSAVGKLRAENHELEYTEHVFPPQLIDHTANEHEIIGEGYVTHIRSECHCSKSASAAHLIAAGVDEYAVNDMRSLVLNGTVPESLVHYVVQKGGIVEVVSILTGTNVCGGTSVSSPRLPVCTTKFTDHIHAEVEVHFTASEASHDGSVTIDKLIIDKYEEPADVSWLYRGLKNLFGANVSSVPLFQMYPGATSPLLWWTTTNRQAVSASVLEAGLEATYAFLNRAAMQRSFTTEAELCVETIIIPTQSTAHISEFGEMFGMIFVIGLLVVNVINFVAAVPWFMSENPIHPAIRLASEPTYFSFMVVAHLTPAITQGVSTAQNVMEVWTKLDNTVRVGEAIHTKDDPEFGKIAIDKPKMVTNFVKGKQYM